MSQSRSAFAVYKQQKQQSRSEQIVEKSPPPVTPERGKKRRKHVLKKLSSQKKRKFHEIQDEGDAAAEEKDQHKTKWRSRQHGKARSGSTVKKKQAKRRRKEEEKEEEIEVEVDVDDDEVEEEEEPIWLSSEIDVSPEGAKAEEPKKSGTAAPPSSSAATCGLQTMKSDGRLDVPFFSQFKPEDYADSRCAARDLFQMLISPVTHEQFYSKVWEKRPLLLRRHKPHYNEGWFSSKEFDQILHDHHIEYSVNLDVTKYESGKRVTLNQSGRAHPSSVWKSFKEGCSIRLLNPQTYSNTVWLLNSTLQEHFNSFVGANVYLTPAGTQGFAPHYDDIEAFVLQLEGKKHWRVYPPKDDVEYLPRHSSKNFSEDELGDSILDVILEPGDLLYFPRGFIHQANALPDSHSLHVTLSSYQKNTWADLLEKLLPAALHVAASEELEFREGLPMDYLGFMGVVHTDINDPRRTEFCEVIASLISKLIQYAPIDNAVDQLGSGHIHSSLPPCLTDREKARGVWEQGCRLVGQGQVQHGTELTLESQVKLVRYGVVRLALEEDGPILYSSLENTRIYQEKELQGLPIEDKDAPAVERLIQSYPDFVLVKDLPFEDPDNRIKLCQSLYNHGLIITR